LQQALQEEWQRIPQVQTQRLIQSMRRRVTTVLQANGGHTRYWCNCVKPFILNFVFLVITSNATTIINCSHNVLNI
jgi:hypothetical protein